MAHITSQTATKAQSSAAVPTSEICTDLEEDSSDSLKEGTHSFAKSVSDSVVSSMSPNSFMAEEKPELGGIEAVVVSSSASASFEDTSSGGVKKKKKQLNKCVKQEENIVIVRDNSRSDGRAIKGGSSADSAVSCVVAELEEGCDPTLLNLATTNMERVNHPDMFSSFGRSSSPYASSDNDWEASDHSDTDADHSDSSDDDNPTSQVDRMIERGARLIMDGENSNLSSETDDTDDSDFDSDSDITDVSPLVSNPGSPLGLSPVMSRRNLPSSISSKPPFMRHYSHKGHDGDVEDETEEDIGTADFAQHWSDDLYHHHHHDDNNTATSDTHINNSDNNPSHNMSMVVHALLQFGLESSRKNSQDNNENIDSVNQNDMSLPHVIRNRHISPVIQANPHHRHLRKNNHHSRRKNMSFTNEEVRIINQDNSTMLEKLIAVSGRQQDETHFNPSYRQNSKPATSCINRKNKEEGIQKDNLALLRRLQEVKPSRAVTATSRNSSKQHHHHHHHHHHHRDHHHHRTPPLATPTATTTTTSAKSCSATARNASYSQAHHHHHHSPKETAL